MNRLHEAWCRQPRDDVDAKLEAFGKDRYFSSVESQHLRRNRCSHHLNRRIDCSFKKEQVNMNWTQIMIGVVAYLLGMAFIARLGIRGEGK